MTICWKGCKPLRQPRDTRRDVHIDLCHQSYSRFARMLAPLDKASLREEQSDRLRSATCDPVSRERPRLWRHALAAPRLSSLSRCLREIDFPAAEARRQVTQGSLSG